MSTRSPNAHFLGIELATDQLRASIVDEQLDLVGVECVDFDADLPDYQYVAFAPDRDSVAENLLKDAGRDIHDTR
jgi:sugar (pentulose or hexulose) kinase